MGDLVVSLAGTEDGSRLALILAIAAAALHAIMSAMQKGRFGPWRTRAAIDLSYGAMALPVALFAVPWPEPHLWPILAAAWIIHAAYKLLQGAAFSMGTLTVVYPVARGICPLATVIAAGMVFGEVFSPLQWAGVLSLVFGVFGVAAVNVWQSHYQRRKLIYAVLLAGLTGLAIAGYTTIDAYGVRAASDPFTFLAWLFLLDGIFSAPAVVAARRGLSVGRTLLRLMPQGCIGGVIAVASFGSIMIATRLDQVGQAAVLRETSVVFAAIIGWMFLNEAIGFWRGSLIAAIAAGAVMVEMGG